VTQRLEMFRYSAIGRAGLVPIREADDPATLVLTLASIHRTGNLATGIAFVLGTAGRDSRIVLGFVPERLNF
jgi:uncharacterized protein with GYD domain